MCYRWRRHKKHRFAPLASTTSDGGVESTVERRFYIDNSIMKYLPIFSTTPFSSAYRTDPSHLLDLNHGTPAIALPKPGSFPIHFNYLELL